MQTTHEFIFQLNDDDVLSVCGLNDSVGLSTVCCGQTDFRIDFRPRHLLELRELIIELEALQVNQQQQEVEKV